MRSPERFNYQRATYEHPKALRTWLTIVQSPFDENNIQAEDIYNLDKTGFAMGTISSQRAVTRENTSVGGLFRSQEFTIRLVLLKAYICADGYPLLLYLIFKGKVAIAG